MISGDEQIRRLLMIFHALREAREVIVDRVERAVNPENLDWFERERFEATMEDSRRVFRRLEEIRLQAAYDSEPVSVKCTAEERAEALRLALDVLEGEVSAEAAVQRVLSERFPHEPRQRTATGR